ncbi:MAG: hypothetical protein K0U59_06980 [Gammaproteobacteria bacterium]|nr:hypothetical protein [Gammaproteobacteria bacterium]
MFKHLSKMLLVALCFMSQPASSSYGVEDRIIINYIPHRWGNLINGWKQIDGNVVKEAFVGIEKETHKKSRVLAFKNDGNSTIAIVLRPSIQHRMHCSIKVTGFIVPNSDDLKNRVRLRDLYLVSFDKQMLAKGCNYDLSGSFDEFILNNVLIEENLLNEMVLHSDIYQSNLAKTDKACAPINKLLGISVVQEIYPRSKLAHNTFIIQFEDKNGYGGLINIAFEDGKLRPLECSTGFED